MHQDIRALLEKAAFAINALTDRQLPSPSSHQTVRLDTPKERFSHYTTQYFTLVKGIGDALRNQAEALERAGCNVGEGARAASLGEITNGGLGNLDVGWLNSRTDDVGALKQAELFAEARELMQKMAKQQQ